MPVKCIYLRAVYRHKLFVYLNKKLTNRAAPAKRMQEAIPMTVGSAAARAVHLRLPVSFLMVSSVVEQGQWNRENSMVQAAVIQVHPFDTNSCFICAIS